MTAVAKVVADSGVVSNTDIAEAIRQEHQQVQALHHCAVQHALLCGELLLKAKSSVAHGDWAAWLDANARFSQRTAQGYMRLARLGFVKAQRVADLTLRQALKEVGEEFSRKQKSLERRAGDDLVEKATVIDIRSHARSVIDVQTVPTSPDVERPIDQASVDVTSTEVEKIIEKATMAIVRWFADTADNDRCHLADTLRAIISEQEGAAR